MNPTIGEVGDAEVPHVPAPAAAVVPSDKTNANLDKANRLLKVAKASLDDLKQQLAAKNEEMESLKQEFQKFRVKAEVSRSQSATEITRLSETNLKYKQFNVSSNDVLNELEACRKRIETLEQTRAGNEAENQRLAERLQQEAAAREHAAQEAREWKLRAEVVGPHAMQQAVGALRAELRELQDECHNLRVVAERGAREKEDALRQVSRLAQTRTDNIDLAYLRDIVLKYLMTQDEKSRAPMEAAITAVLRFAPEELERIRAAKRGWFGV